ncbi:RNA polymerase sigma factor [Bacillus mesophilus]|uniref:RNA polymerase sigma factor n=1 Tax=Bacillus mesophilus TaxID=1808955 RepID=A0A6M0Q452_9BACI|nr:RNA polymerase sigma factor [Bacillus mesophilus]
MVDDQQLTEEIKSGSEAAMEVLTRKYYKPIYAFVYRKVGNKDTAYDLTQEIFIKVIQRIPSYSQKGTFKSWLYTIAVNHCRDYWRSAPYQSSLKQSELPQSLESKERSVSYIFERKETREQVRGAIQSLPDYQKEALILKYYQDMKIKEIAEVTNSSIPTVKSRLKQGLGKLANLLRGGEENGQAKK